MAREGDELFLCAAVYDLTRGEWLELCTKGLQLEGDAGGEKPEIRRDAVNEVVMMIVHGNGVEITNVKVSNHAAERNGAVAVDEGG